MTLDIRDHHRTHVELERDGSFPPYDVCDDDASFRVATNVAEQLYGCRVSDLPLKMLEYIQSSEAAATNLDESTFNILSLVPRNGSISEATCYLNYATFNPCFELSRKTVITKLSDIYVPSVDDLDIVDGDFQWLIHITHERDAYVRLAV